MEDKELDNLLAKWAQEEMEVPFDVHEKTMQRIRREARRQKTKRWSSLAAVAAVCCLCVPLAVTQAGGEKQTAEPERSVLMLARTEATESNEMVTDTTFAVNSAVIMEEKSMEEIWIERLSQLESDSRKLKEEKENYRQTPTPQALAVLNAETERLLKKVEEYEQTLDPEYTALNLRLKAVKEELVP